MTAYARIIPPGPDSLAICEPCAWIEPHPRRPAALDAVREHNRTRHADPDRNEQP